MIRNHLAMLTQELGNVFKGVNVELKEFRHEKACFNARFEICIQRCFHKQRYWAFVSVCPATYIFNTDPKGGSYNHWVTVYIDEVGFTTYFDPNGQYPQQPSFIDFLAEHACEWWYSRKMY